MKSIELFIIRILILILGGAVFFAFKQWFILPVFALIWFLFELNIVKVKNMKLIKLSILIGIILMIFDFAFENWGAIYGYWRTINSSFFVLAVPIEIMLTCIFGGAAWTLFVSKYKGKFFIAINLVLWSIGGMAGEYFLMATGFMNYGNGWLSIPHAFMSYFLTFVLFYFVSFSIINNANKK
jgi:hypothetical protein